MRRALWILAAAALVAAGAGAVTALRTTSTGPTHWSLAQVKAALVPLSEMPAGTEPVKFVGGGSSDSSLCTKAGPRANPLVHAQASFAYVSRVNGIPSRAEDLFEVVSAYDKGTAAHLLNDLRKPSRCPTEVSPLAFPRVASDQVSFQLTIPNLGRVDFIYLRVNDSAIVAVSAEFPSGSPDARTVTFARKAYTRAKSKLGG